jgi:hypothetical protein
MSEQGGPYDSARLRLQLIKGAHCPGPISGRHE